LSEEKEQKNRYFHIERKLTRAEKKRRKSEEMIGGQTGIVTAIPMQREEKRFYVYLANAMLNFILVLGTLGCLVEGLSVAWNPFLLSLVLFPCAVLFSLFYRSRWIRIVGYIGIVILFFTGVQQMYLYLRSGSAIISNRLMKLLEEQLHLPVEREFEIYLDDEGRAIFICLLFIGIVFMMLFNIVISEIKNYWIVLLFTFPIVQLPIYLSQKMPLLYFILYAAGIASLFVLRTNGHFAVVGGKEKNFRAFYRKKSLSHSYRAGGKINLCIMAFVLAVFLFFALIMYFLYPQEKSEKWRASVWKTETENMARRMALVGFYGMLSRGETGVGGIGAGKLGNVRYVMRDYETDLNLYIEEPVQSETIYLRAFSAKDYHDNEWFPEEDEASLADCVHAQPGDCFVYLDSLDQMLLGVQQKRMRMDNVGANPEYAYMPYWNYKGGKNWSLSRMQQTEWSSGEVALNVREYTELLFYPGAVSLTIEELQRTVQKQKKDGYGILWDVFFKQEEIYRENIYKEYLEVEDAQKERLLKLCAENGIIPNHVNIENDENTVNQKRRNADYNDGNVIGSIVENVQDFLREQYLYSLVPGTTPEGEDFVDYFLFTQKKGYCTYFASAAALIYRSLGIPARYVTGYVVQPDDIFAGSVINGRQAGWENSVRARRITVSDANAHAWVEVYIDGFGWYPVEVTTSEEEEEQIVQQTDSPFQNMLSAVFAPEAVQAVRKTTILFLQRVLTVIFLLLLFYFLSVMTARFWVLQRWKKGRGRQVLFQIFLSLRAAAHAGGERFEKNCTHRKSWEKIAQAAGLSEEDATAMLRLMEQFLYSSRGVTEENVTWYAKRAVQACREIEDRAVWHRKIRIKFGWHWLASLVISFLPAQNSSRKFWM